MTEYEVVIGEDRVRVDFQREASKATAEGTRFEVSTTEYGNRVIVDVDGKSYSIELVDGKVLVNGEACNFTIQKARPHVLTRRKESEGPKSASVMPPMPGRIVSVAVKVGETVTKGQGLMVLEAMKMQNEITAPTDGMVKAIHCKTGDNVEQSKVLVDIA